MKIKFYLSFLITIISFSVYSQIIEEKKEGEFLIKNFLNKDLEIVKIEKHKGGFMIETFEYLPGGKIKNGKFGKDGVGYGVYENGKIKEGSIYYETTIDNISGLRFYGDLKISDFKLKGNVELYYDTKKVNNSNPNKKPELMAKLNFNENGLLEGKQFYNDRKFKYYLEYKNGNPMKYQKKENEIFIDSITFNDEITKNVTYLLNQNIYNRQQPRLIFNPFNYFIQLNDDCYNSTNENESNHENIWNTGYTNDLKRIVLNYSIKQDCNNRKIDLNGINIVFEIKSPNYIEKISKSDYSSFPSKLGNLFMNDLVCVDYFFISEILLGRSGHKILANNLSDVPKEIRYETYGINYLNNNFIKSTYSEHAILSNLLFNLTTSGFKIDYGKIDFDTRKGYSESITENIDIFKEINYFLDGDLFYKIDFSNNEFVEIKNEKNIEKRHYKVFHYFNKLSKDIIDVIPTELMVINESETSEINKKEEKNTKFHELKRGVPDKMKIKDFFKNLPVLLSEQEKIHEENDKKLFVGKEYLGGVIVYLDNNGINGLVVSKDEFVNLNYEDAVNECTKYDKGGKGWYLPNIEEMKLLKDLDSSKKFEIGIGRASYWTSSTEKVTNTHGDKMAVANIWYNDYFRPKVYELIYEFNARAVKKF